MNLKTFIGSVFWLGVAFWLTSTAAFADVGFKSPDYGLETSGYYFRPTKNQYEEALYANPNEYNGEKQSEFMLTSLVNGLNKMVVGLQPETIEKYRVYEPGAIQLAGSLNAILIANPPVSTAEYLADLGSSLGLVKPAYAQQGTGWQVLHGVMDIWKAFRNLTYLFFVIVFVLIGFMIMLRAKINAQTVISIESAIPNLILTLILITFSYALASLMIDLMWLGFYLVINIFSAYGLINHEYAQNQLLSQSVLSLGWSNASSIITSVSSLIVEVTAEALGIQSSLFKTIVSNTLGFLVIGIAYLFSLFKLFFQLVISYITLVLMTIFAPFQLLANAFPGSQAFSKWLKTMLANVLVFPATAVMFLLIGAIGGIKNWQGSNPISMGSGSGSGGVPLLGMGNTEAVKALLVLGLVMMLPKVVELIKGLLKVEKGGVAPGLLAGAFAPLMTAASMPSQALQTIIQVGQARQYISKPKDLTGLEPIKPPPGP
jgi:hypothetical protein